MILTIIVAFFSIILLLVIHEFGHFFVAKIFKVKVEEFGVFLPPRLLARKIGETVYSLNLIPFGAFVKVLGEEGGIEDVHSFSEKPIWQRALIVAAGVISFWLVAIIILTIIAGVWGMPVLTEDDQDLIDPKIQIGRINLDSPAYQAGIRVGDTIVGFEKIAQFQEFIEQNKGQEIVLLIERRNQVFETEPIVPRVSPPPGQGALGVGLIRVALQPYPWHKAPLQGVLATGRLAQGIVSGWAMGINHILGIEKIPEDIEMEVVGPVGIVSLLGQYFETGLNDFLYFIALITIALALINSFPIPALDGGKLLFLLIEKIKGRSINPKIEQKITAGFFIVLIFLMALVTIRDIVNLF